MVSSALTIQRFSDSTWHSHFPRNAAWNFAKYISERTKKPSSPSRNQGSPKQCWKTKLMQNRNIIFTTILLVLALACFVPSPTARAVCQEGCLPNANTVLGDDALLNTTGGANTAIGFDALVSNTTGSNNTASGFVALVSNTTGGGNTATGVGALEFNTIGFQNTATGSAALGSNTTGSYNTASGDGALFSNNADNNTATGFQSLSSNTTGTQNTASGVGALYSNTAGSYNTAAGLGALYSNTTADNNTANGINALLSNTTGYQNTACGGNALLSNGIGINNTANGFDALYFNTTGNLNTANGVSALQNNTTGSSNTADGVNALLNNTTGSSNVALGFQAGLNLTTGSNNIDIGANVLGNAADANTIRIGKPGTQQKTFIAGIYGKTVNGAVGVFINSNGQLGTVQSSARYKQDIKPMDKASEAILALKPVTFRYKKEIDPDCTAQFGLVAEDVQKASPDLVVRDTDGNPETVRYDAVNAMLLNEFLKEHQKVQQLEVTIVQQREHFEATIAELKEELEAVAARSKSQNEEIQKVKAQVVVNGAGSRVVANKP
ncbi:MAG: hypothetical protein C5B58_04385 [Acidobacteria bacterium]|nr:MAG: hypothetical protein C5B58_04385 [Acidobacteriota bacterium]